MATKAITDQICLNANKDPAAEDSDRNGEEDFEKKFQITNHNFQINSNSQ